MYTRSAYCNNKEKKRVLWKTETSWNSDVAARRRPRTVFGGCVPHYAVVCIIRDEKIVWKKKKKTRSQSYVFLSRAKPAAGRHAPIGDFFFFFRRTTAERNIIIVEKKKKLRSSHVGTYETVESRLPENRRDRVFRAPVFLVFPVRRR